MLLYPIHTAILRGDTYKVYTYADNPVGFGGLPSTYNSRTVAKEAFWFHSVDGHEPLVYQAYRNFAYRALVYALPYVKSEADLLHFMCDSLIWRPIHGAPIAT